MTVDELIERLTLNREFVGGDAEVVSIDVSQPGTTSEPITGIIHSTSPTPIIILAAGA